MTAIVLVAGLIGLVWGTWFVLRGSIWGGCLAYLVTLSCLGYELVHFDLGPLPLTIDRLVLGLICGTYFIRRATGHTAPKGWGADALLLGGMLVVLCVSTFTHDWHASLAGQTSPVWRLIGGYLIPAMLYWVARQSALDERDTRWFQRGMVVFGVYLAVTAVLEITGQWGLVFPRYIANPNVGVHFGRARGPMVHSVSFGHYLALALCCLWLCMTRASKAANVLLAGVAGLFAAGLFFTYTRSVWLGAGLGLLILFGLTLPAAWRKLVLVASVSAAVLLAGLNYDRLVAFKRDSSAADTQKSASMRSSFAYVSWLMFKERPVFGFGFGQFPEAKLPYLSNRTTELQLESIRDYVHHNTFLSLLTETGVVGFGLFMALVGMWVRRAWHVARNPRLPAWARSQATLMLGGFAIWGCQLLFHELSYTPVDNVLPFVLAGMTMALPSHAPRAHLPRRERGTVEFEWMGPPTPVGPPA